MLSDNGKHLLGLVDQKNWKHITMHSKIDFGNGYFENKETLRRGYVSGINLF